MDEKPEDAILVCRRQLRDYILAKWKRIRFEKKKRDLIGNLGSLRFFFFFLLSCAANRILMTFGQLGIVAFMPKLAKNQRLISIIIGENMFEMFNLCVCFDFAHFVKSKRLISCIDAVSERQTENAIKKCSIQTHSMRHEKNV